jgi:hypothetical protein
MLLCSSTVAACPHVLQALNALPFHMACMPMMDLTSGAMETCARTLKTCEPSYTDMPFFMFEARGSQETAGHVVVAPEPSW